MTKRSFGGVSTNHHQGEFREMGDFDFVCPSFSTENQEKRIVCRSFATLQSTSTKSPPPSAAAVLLPSSIDTHTTHKTSIWPDTQNQGTLHHPPHPRARIPRVRKSGSNARSLCCCFVPSPCWKHSLGLFRLKETESKQPFDDPTTQKRGAKTEANKQ